MRVVMLLLLASVAVAAPGLKPMAKPSVELTLAAKSQSVLEITIHNHGKEPLELPYQSTWAEHLEVSLVGEQGMSYTILHAPDPNRKATPGTLTIPAGQSHTLEMHTCHYLLEVGEPGQKITFTARLKQTGKAIESKPLRVDP